MIASTVREVESAAQRFAEELRQQYTLGFYPQNAADLGVRDGQLVQVRIDSEGRDLVFGDVTVRIAPDFHLELHLDTDEANAAGVTGGDRAQLLDIAGSP